jgi:hypothetical protein
VEEVIKEGRWREKILGRPFQKGRNSPLRISLQAIMDEIDNPPVL